MGHASVYTSAKVIIDYEIMVLNISRTFYQRNVRGPKDFSGAPPIVLWHHNILATVAYGVIAFLRINGCA